MTTNTSASPVASVAIRPATDRDLPAIETLLTSSHLPIDGVSADDDRRTVFPELWFSGHASRFSA